MQEKTGEIVRINGPAIFASGTSRMRMGDQVLVGDQKLAGEIIRLDGELCTIQVYEDTTGVKPGEPVVGLGFPSSVELGPGMLGSIYDGIQRPLDAIFDRTGTFIKRGVDVARLDRKRRWHFEPRLAVGAHARGGDIIGVVQETELIEHRIMLPPKVSGVIKEVAGEGDYTVTETVAVIETEDGRHAISMCQRWPVRIARVVDVAGPLPSMPD